MITRDTNPGSWAEAVWVAGGVATTIALLTFIVAGAALGWFG